MWCLPGCGIWPCGSRVALRTWDAPGLLPEDTCYTGFPAHGSGGGLGVGFASHECVHPGLLHGIP